MKPERLVGLHRVLALVLQLVGAHLVQEPDAASLLPEVDEDAAPRSGDDRERLGELISAVAALRPEHVARETLRVHPHQDGVVAADLAHGERQDHAVVHRGLVGDGVEGAVRRRQERGGGPPDQLVLLDAVLDQVLDGDHPEAVPRGERGELRQARHLAPARP